MRIKLIKPCFVGKVVRPRGWVGEASTVEEGKALIAGGVAVETNAKPTPDAALHDKTTGEDQDAGNAPENKDAGDAPENKNHKR